MEALATAAGLLLLGWLSHFPNTPLAVGLVLLCRLWDERSTRAVWLASLAYFFIVPLDSDHVSAAPPAANLVLAGALGAPAPYSPALKAGSLLLTWLAGYALFRLARRLSALQRLAVLHLGLLAVVGLGAGSPLGLVTMIGFGWSFYYLCQVSLEGRPLSLLDFCRRTTPPWFERVRSGPMIHAEPGPPLPRALRLAWGGSLALLVYRLAASVASAHLPWLADTGMDPSLFESYPIWQLWLAVLANGLRVWFAFLGTGLFAEGCYCALGYSVLPRFGRVWRCSSLIEIYACIIPYYVLLLREVYLYPCYSALRRRGLERRRAFALATLFAVVGGGLATHVARDLHLVAGLGAGESLRRYLVLAGPYFLLVLLALATVRLPRRWPAVVKLPLLLTAYSLLLVTRQGGLELDPAQRWRFVQMLFGFSG